MSFLKKLFGKSSEPAQPPLLKPPPASPPPPGAPATLKAWDAYGRICEIPREEWRTQVLPLNFQKTWNNPEQLAALIDNALNDGFIADCLEPARQLHRTDAQPKRGATYLAVILLQLNKFDEAEKIVIDALQQHGDDGVLLTNLAKAYSGKGDHARAEGTLWRALEVDPNLDNGLLWYVAIHRDRGGEEAAQDCLRRVAALPGSWRAQLWIARSALQSRQLEQALTLYRECLAHVGKPVPGDLLQQMSGDLGNAGHLPELLQLAGPCYDPVLHGLPVGNNLIKANFDLGQFDAARRLLDRLYALDRTDWKEHLSYWEMELTKARVALAEEPKVVPPVAILSIDGPVWLKPDSPAAELFPAKPGAVPTVAFLGCTAEIATNSKRIQQQMSDAPGRMSRALPLYLAEHIAFAGAARVQTLVPWVMGDSPAFVVSGGPWEDDAASVAARQGAIKNEFIVTIHLKPTTEPWTAELRLVQTIDAKCLGTMTGNFSSTTPEDGMPALVRQLLALLKEHAEIQPVSPPPLYQVPVAPDFANYLVRLEQLLAVRCSGMDGVPPEFLHGAREVIDGNLHLCLNNAENVTTRILLLQTVKAMKRVRPEIVGEYRDKLQMLQREHPLDEPAQGVCQRLLNEVLAA